MQGKIVVAEKSATVRRMVEISLAKHPFELIYTEDGQSTLAAVRAHAPVAVIVDAALPGIDGYAVARALKGDTATQGIKLLLLVGRNTRFDNARARQSGVDGHLPKPFLTQKLVESVFTALGQAVPDKGLFRSTTLNIPLANKSNAAPAPTPQLRRQPAPSRQRPVSRPPAPMAKRPASVRPAPMRSAPPAEPSTPPPEVIGAAVAATTAAMNAASAEMGLEGASREIIERIAWEIIPQLAEAILKEEIAKVVRQRLNA